MRLAVVVQRYGREVVGGAELHARWIAEHLARRHDVEVLTTTAIDYLSWTNEYPAGPTEVDGVRVRRFPVARPRTLEGFSRASALVHPERAPERDELRWLDEHGPVAPALVEHLRAHGRTYDAAVHFCYRYWTTFHALSAMPARSILVPTAEDDWVVGLSIFGDLFRRAGAFAFNTPEERELLERAAGIALPGEVVGVGLDQTPLPAPAAVRQRLDLPARYVAYVGRIEKDKGCSVLFEHFLRYVNSVPAPPRLVLVGKAVLGVPAHPSIVHLGVLPEEDKLGVLAGSEALVHPSPYESLSLSLLECWRAGRPALVNGRCAVLRGQVERANGGLYWRSWPEFAEALTWIQANPAAADMLGQQGRAYYEREYDWEVVLARYERLLAQVAGA